jgi:hypothetical protein
LVWFEVSSVFHEVRRSNRCKQKSIVSYTYSWLEEISPWYRSQVTVDFRESGHGTRGAYGGVSHLTSVVFK